MLPTDVLNTLRALSLNERPLITPLPDKDPSGKSAFEVGQKVQGAIQAEVSPGVFNVRVLNQMLHMQLPTDLKSGDVVELQVMSLQPRLTFSLSASNTPLSTPEQLSNTSRLLSSLSQQPLEKSYVRALQSTPLWAASTKTPDTTALAVKLHESLSQSGLFYESHQAQWIAGARSTAQLLLEPQNVLTDPLNTALASANDKALLIPSNPLTSGIEANNPLQQGMKTVQQDNSLPNIPNQLQPLVQHQLNALETRQVMWHGEVWPNQQMDWEIHEETPHQGGSGYAEATGPWATQIRLDLPHLGEVTAMLRFGNNGLSITLDAEGARTRALFGNTSSQLTAALSERGIKVSSTLIATHDNTG